MQIDLGSTDLDGLSPDWLRAQVCIVGGGIAGLVLAQHLARRSVSVLLLEAGGADAEKEEPTGAPRTEMLGHPHAGLLEGSPRALGGSSLVWGGQMLPLPGASGPRWPVSCEALARFEAEAERLFGVNSLPYDAEAFFRTMHARTPNLLGASTSWLTARLSKFAPFRHRNLARTLGQELRTHPNVHVLLNARALELHRAVDGPERLEAVTVGTSSGRRLKLHADQFVLAAGTLETVRLLLASRERDPAGVGNGNEQVGRNVHDHLTLTAATFSGAARQRMIRELGPWVVPGPAGSVQHSVKLEVSSESGEPNLPLMAHLTVEEPPGSGVDALRALLQARQLSAQSMKALAGRLPRLPGAAAAALRVAWLARFERRRYVSSGAVVDLRLNAAQRTPSESRILLSEAKGSFGEPLPALRWVIAAEECDGLRQMAHALRSLLEKEGVQASEMSWTPQLFGPEEDGDSALIAELTDARHLMGGAVLGDDPRTSVVSAELQVHGIPNLHVASLAVFPDGAAQLPTLTLMALALRLGERLAAMCGGFVGGELSPGTCPGVGPFPSGVVALQAECRSLTG